MTVLTVFLTALIPLIIGFIWYHPKVFGNKWMKAVGISAENARNPNMVLIFSLTYLFSLFVATVLRGAVIHQTALDSLFFLQPIKDPSTEAGALYKSVMDMVGNSHRTFKHGSFHGTLVGLFIALPIIGVNALFERKGFSYIAINTGFWIVCLALMGGVLCAFT